MRVCSVLLVAAAALIAISSAIEPSATSTVKVAEVQARGADKRFLRSHQTEEEQGDSDVNEEEDDSEERGINVDDALAILRGAVKSRNNDAVDALLPHTILAKANNGDFDMQTKLFQQWLKAKPEVRQNAISTIMRNGGYDDYKTLLTAWRYNSERTTSGVGFHGSTKAVDKLLPRGLIDKAALGNVQARETLFGKWIAAPSETRDTALKILHDSGMGKPAYTRLNSAWLRYLNELVK
uniref:RxLR effector protein n=1 Tax=Phytophthora cinnamomi var. robiniae TaxID=708041 RepID=A0A3G3MDG9_PHYCI|nr:Avh89 protein [Phytophthora cinnamomi var. robiniae]